MKKSELLTTQSLTAVMLVMMTVPARAAPYTIDGDLSDWSVNPGNWDADIPAVSVVENWPYAGVNPGIEQCDIEAMYVDEMHISGDLAVDFNKDGCFEYGIKLTKDRGALGTVNAEIGTVFQNPAWVLGSPPQCAHERVPFSNLVSGTTTGKADIVL